MNEEPLDKALAAPLGRVVGRVQGAVESVRTLAPKVDALEAAVEAVLAIGRGPKHLLRPQLVLLGHRGAGGAGAGPEAESLAAGVELLHLFMLVHDDVMDHGVTRRGAPTLHHALRRDGRFGGAETCAHLALVFGDLLYTRAVELLLDAGSAEAARWILDGAARAGAGQVLDLVGWRGRGDLAGFRRALLDKGGHHSVTAPLCAGLRLADPAADLSAATAWGDAMGLALQGADDLQDLLAPPTMTGKDGLQDIREGRLSLPIFLLTEALDAAGAARLRGSAGPLTAEARAELFGMLRAHDVFGRSLAFVGEALDAAAAAELQGPPAFVAPLRVAEARLRGFLESLAALAADWG